MNNQELQNFVNEHACRDFDHNETLAQLKRINTALFICWGATAFTRFAAEKPYQEWSKALRFKVNGFKHKGHVYIFLDFDDTYKIVYTTIKGRVLHIDKGIYFDQLTEVIDNYVENTRITIENNA